MERVSLMQLSEDTKLQLLRSLGYGSDGTYVLDEKGERMRDRYIDEEIRISNMLILPGSVVVLDNNPLSIAFYLEEYGHDI